MDPNSPPPVYSPSVLGPTLGALGMGAPGFGAGAYQQQMQMMGGMAMAGNMAGFIGHTALPLGAVGLEMASMASPMLMAGASRRLSAPWMLGAALRPLDAVGNAAMSMGWGGMKTGWGMGMGVGRAVGSRALGGVLGAGMGLAGGVAMAAPPAMATMAATEAAVYGGQQFFQGAQGYLSGQALMSQLAPTAMPGQSYTRGQAGQVGREIQNLGDDLGLDMKQMSGLMGQMNQMGMFQTVSSLKEFRGRYKEVLGAVKEIATELQTTLDDALQTFGDLRNQGFYSSADIKSQAARDQARGVAGGITNQRLQQAGQYGSQVSRAYGMYGKTGSEVGKASLAAVQAALRSGAVSEEMVMEMGGPDAAAAMLSRSQLGFLGSAQGTAMIAAGGTNILGRGMSVESIVEAAANSGIGGIMHARSREAKEAFAPYAGMAMIDMAMAQQKQLYGGANYQGTVGMLGTMGLGQDAAELLIKSTMAMPKQLQRENQEAHNQSLRADWDDLRDRSKMTSRVSETISQSGFARGARRWGRAFAADTERWYRQSVEGLTGRREDTVEAGDLALARMAGDDLMGGYGTPGSALFGIENLRDRRRREGISGEDYIQGVREGSAAELSEEGRMALQRMAQRDGFGDLRSIVGASLLDALPFGNPGLQQGKARQENLFRVAKRIGLTNAEDMSGWSEGSQGRAYGMIMGELEQMGLGDLGREMLGDVEMATGTVKSAEGARRFLDEQLKGWLGPETEMFGGIMDLGESQGLRDMLLNNGDFAMNFNQYMELMKEGKILEASRVYNKMRDMAGDNESVIGALDSMQTEMEDDPKYRKKLTSSYQDHGIGYAFKRKSAFEVMEISAKRENAAANRFLDATRRGDRDLSFAGDDAGALKASVERLQTATAAGGSFTDRRAALKEIYSLTAKGGFSREEQEFLLDLSGGDTRVLGLAGKIEGLATGSAADQRKILQGLAKDEDELERMMDVLAGEGEGFEKAIDVLVKLNALDYSLLEGGEGSKNLAGTQTKYVEANTAFVTAVHQFTHAVAKVIPEVGVVDAPGELESKE